MLFESELKGNPTMNDVMTASQRADALEEKMMQELTRRSSSSRAFSCSPTQT